MSVYPFYVEADAEGRRSMIKGGTRRSDGNMDTTIYVRDEGSITDPIHIKQYHDFSGDEHKLITDVSYNGERVVHHVTKY